MRWLNKISAVLLLALWVPVAAHCSLERLTASSLLACCCEDQDSEAPERDCQEQVCSLIESGSVKHEDGALHTPLLDLAERFEIAAAPQLEALPTSSVLRCIDHTSPPRVWPCWLRTVQPPLGPTAL